MTFEPTGRELLRIQFTCSGGSPIKLILSHCATNVGSKPTVLLDLCSEPDEAQHTPESGTTDCDSHSKPLPSWQRGSSDSQPNWVSTWQPPYATQPSTDSVTACCQHGRL
jgi:hypothetical protein